VNLKSKDGQEIVDFKYARRVLLALTVVADKHRIVLVINSVIASSICLYCVIVSPTDTGNLAVVD